MRIPDKLPFSRKEGATVLCPTCNGKGFVRNPLDSIEAGTFAGCPTCRGAGRVVVGGTGNDEPNP